MEDKETVTLLPGQTIIGTKYTKSNYVERLEKENAELKAENARLKEENFNFEEIVKLCRCEQYQQTLQEIEKIAEAPSPFIDNFEIKSATEVGYDYAAICNELELRLHKVLELITKAESEEE